MAIVSRRAYVGIFLLALIFAAPLKPLAVVFDLGDTLITRNLRDVAYYVGYWDGFLMWLEHGGAIKARVGDVLMRVLADGTEQADDKWPLDSEGRLMPRVMCDWFMGKITSAQALDFSLMQVERYQFAMKREKAVVKATVKWMFNPRAYGTSMTIIPGALKLLKDIDSLRDQDGNQLHQLYIISNYDRESFKYVYDNMQELFSWFAKGRRVISAFVDDMKPNHSIFINFMRKHNLDPANCVMIDDQEENVIAARASGMHAIRIVNLNYAPVRRQLNRLGVNVTTV